MKSPLIVSLSVASLFAGGLARAAVYTPTNDTYVRIDNSGPYGSAQNINVKLSGGGTSNTVRKGLISFAVPYGDTVSATLTLSVSMFDDVNGATSAGFHVWGIAGGIAGCGAHFNEATAVYNDFPELRSTATGVNPTGNCITDLGTFTVQASDLGHAITFQSPALTNFVANPFGVATFIITRTTDSDSLNTGFASKENTSLPGPTLTVTSSTVPAISKDTYHLGASRTDAFCYSTAQATPSDPVRILSSDLGNLEWDPYGNLVVRNWLDNNAVVAKWGLGSSVALTGSSAATVCFGGGGGLRIYDASGNVAWRSTSSAGSDTLTLDHCTLETLTAGAIDWKETPTACNKPNVTANPSWCLPVTSSTQRVLWEDAIGAELDFAPDGNLSYSKGGKVLWSTNTHTGTKLCHQWDDNLVIYSGTTPLWASNTAGVPAGKLTLDGCGVALTDGQVEYWRQGDVACDATVLSPGVWGHGWCRTTGAAGVLLHNENATLTWGTDGLLYFDTAGDHIVINSGHPGAQVCMVSDRLTVDDANGSAVWMSGGGALTDSLILEGCTLATATVQDPACIGLDPAPPGCAPAPASVDVHWSVSSSSCFTKVSGGGFAFTKDMHFGDSTVGAEMWIVAAGANAASINNLKLAIGTGHVANEVNAALPQGSVPSGYAQLIGGAGISATLFGVNNTLLDMNGYVENLNGPNSNVELVSLGTTYLNGPIAASTSKSIDMTFFTAEQEFEIAGIIPVTCTEDVTGTVGVSASLTAQGSISANVTPYGSLTAGASVGVGVSGASAGVEGSLTLIDLSVPVSQSITFGSPSSYQTSAELDINTLSGEIDLYAELGPFKATKQLTSWNGYSTTVPLYSQGGSL